MQSKLGSLIEVALNTLIGFCISLVANAAILPMFGHGHPTLLNNLGMTAAFTALSLVRSYVLRRWFNYRITAAANRAAVALHHKGTNAST